MTELKEVREIYSEFIRLPSTEELKNVSWADTSRVHNWRNYIWGDVKINWTEFSDIRRLILYCRAEEKADAEEWR